MEEYPWVQLKPLDETKAAVVAADNEEELVEEEEGEQEVEQKKQAPELNVEASGLKREFVGPEQEEDVPNCSCYYCTKADEVEEPDLMT